MKLFSIFSRPNSELNNKQKGQTFMELVIILLIAGTAVICIIWYFYWVLQSSVIDLKYKLEDVRTAMYTQCGLPNPEPHVGPQPGGNGNGEVPPEMLGPFGPFVHTAGNIIPGIPFATQHIVVYNTSLGGAFPPEDMTVKVWYDWNGSTFTSSQTFTGIVPPDAMPYEVGSVTQTLPSGPGVYDIEVLGVATNTMNAGAINYWTEIWSGPSGYPTIP